ncbi:DUF6262 family protein [Nonomuraea zeae]|uniref:DUF6262 family protein n=1 Tax=Nonomuraea zeae TaxID=1642303 RepID=UPI00197F7118|nr:DUF6262 family protein [Nonomuraea zeae]
MIDLNRRSTPTDGGTCPFQVVVDGGACPWKLDCENCDKFVMTGADLLYWQRKRDQCHSLAGSASSKRHWPSTCAAPRTTPSGSGAPASASLTSPLSAPDRTPHDHRTRTLAANQARQQRIQTKLMAIEEALRVMHRERAPITYPAVARRADVSRSFLYQNPDAKTLMETALATTGNQRSQDRARGDATIEASWRERALNAEGWERLSACFGRRLHVQLAAAGRRHAMAATRR